MIRVRNAEGMTWETRTVIGANIAGRMLNSGKRPVLAGRFLSAEHLIRKELPWLLGNISS